MKSMKQIIATTIIALRRGIYGVLALCDRVIPFRRPMVTVFCYHSIGTDDWRFAVSLENLKQQILVLKKYADPLTLEQVAQYVEGTFVPKRPGFLVTFDDGYRDILSTGAFFREQGIRPVVFALANPAEANRSEMDNDKSLLTTDELLSLKASGWDIGCHSATHAHFATLDEASTIHEVREAKTLLEKNLGMPIDSFAYPKGGYTESIVEKLREAGFRMAFTVEHGIIAPRRDEMLIPRVGVDQTHSLNEFSVMSTILGIRFKECLAKVVGKWL